MYRRRLGTVAKAMQSVHMHMHMHVHFLTNFEPFMDVNFTLLLRPCVLSNASYASRSHGNTSSQVEGRRQDTVECSKLSFCTRLVARFPGRCVCRACIQVALQDHYARMLQIPGAKLKPASLKPVSSCCLTSQHQDGSCSSTTSSLFMSSNTPSQSVGY